MFSLHIFILKGYWQSRRNRMDFMVTLLGVIWIILNYTFNDHVIVILGYVVILLRFCTITGKFKSHKITWWIKSNSLSQPYVISNLQQIFQGNIQRLRCLSRLSSCLSTKVSLLSCSCFSWSRVMLWLATFCLETWNMEKPLTDMLISILQVMESRCCSELWQVKLTKWHDTVWLSNHNMNSSECIW